MSAECGACLQLDADGLTSCQVLSATRDQFNCSSPRNRPVTRLERDEVHPGSCTRAWRMARMHMGPLLTRAQEEKEGVLPAPVPVVPELRNRHRQAASDNH